uniref:Uncharacterized protein n=1 Tax=Micrurus lemniscatus lemniscatus TaxID=129467 RepID=A0A2D4J6M4_MICLE
MVALPGHILVEVWLLSVQHPRAQRRGKGKRQTGGKKVASKRKKNQLWGRVGGGKKQRVQVFCHWLASLKKQHGLQAANKFIRKQLHYRAAAYGYKNVCVPVYFF